MDSSGTIVDTALQEDVKALEELSTRLGWITRRRFEQELDNFGLTVPQYVALRCVMNNNDGCSMSELAEAAGQVSATMTGIVDRLVDRGLVTRERDPRDRRALKVVMTPKGSELMERVSTYKLAWAKQFLATLSLEDRRLMIDMGRRYLAHLEETVQPA